MYKLLLSLTLIASSCSTTTYYVVRHAEKEAQAPNMSSDVPLSAAGAARATALREALKNKHIQYIYSTNTIRTKSTGRPLADVIGAPIETYDPRDTSFVSYVKGRGRGSALIVGHSNTVDDIVNKFLGRAELSDLPDSQFGDLFIITRKGKNYSFSHSHFGQ
jgi:phosphohistidine phosphatase SixA